MINVPSTLSALASFYGPLSTPRALAPRDSGPLERPAARQRPVVAKGKLGPGKGLAPQSFVTS